MVFRSVMRNYWPLICRRDWGRVKWESEFEFAASDMIIPSLFIYSYVARP